MGSILAILLVVSGPRAWPSPPPATLQIEKSDGGLRMTSPGAADIGVVPLGSNRFAIILAIGNPPRIHIVYFGELADPGPTPGPTIAEATRLAREWLLVVPEQARARAPLLAAAFESVARRIEQGELKDVQAIIAASTAANREALGDLRNDWLPWFEKLRQYMNGLADAGRLASGADHARLFREIAEGLKP